MSRHSVRSQGYLVVRFPPPAPQDLGSLLRRSISSLLGRAGECCAINTGALDPEKPGWRFEIRIKKPNETLAWADRIEGWLREQTPQIEAVLEVAQMRGPVEIDLHNLNREMLKRLCDKKETSANLLLEVADCREEFPALAHRIETGLSGRANVTKAYALPADATWLIDIPDTVDLFACLETLRKALALFVEKGAVRLAMHTITCLEKRVLT